MTGEDGATAEADAVGDAVGDRWCLVEVADVRVALPGIHVELTLSETGGPRRALCIPVGLAEGRAIAYAWRAAPTPRPLTHELFRTVLDVHGVQVAAVRITDRQGGRFVAELDTVGPDGRHVVSCRPSDAVALALRQGMPTPILVAEHVLAGPAPGAGAATA